MCPVTLPGINFDFSLYPSGREGFLQQWLLESIVAQALIGMSSVQMDPDAKNPKMGEAQQLTIFEVAPIANHALMNDDFMLGLVPRHQIPSDLTQIRGWCLIEHINESDVWLVYPAQIDDYTKDDETSDMLLGLSVMARSSAEPKLANWAPASAYCKLDASGVLSSVVCILKRKNWKHWPKPKHIH